MKATLKLEIEPVDVSLQTLDQLPTSSGAFPLMLEIKKKAS
jgi:hypothetical protein